MAQTTGALSMKDVQLDYSTNNSDWTDISGVTNAVTPSGNNRITGEAYTADGEDAIVLIGKREPFEVDFGLVYSETTTEGYTVLDTIFAAGTALRLRWSPGGGDTGDYRFTTGTGYLVEFNQPGGDVQDGNPILISGKFRGTGYTRATIS